MSDPAALRAALSHMRITSPDGTALEAALAEEKGWTPGFAERVVDEYCGFLYLAATAGFEVTPSQAVDEAWHLHLAWPHYRDVLCREMIGRPLEHRPGTGEPGEDERYARQYEETLALYEEVFGKPPTADIWPRPVELEEEGDEAQWSSRQRSGRRTLIAVGAATAFAAIAAFETSTVAALFIACIVAGLLLSLVLPGLAPKGRRKNAGCSGGCGADMGGGGSCSASCGGGCGGD